MAWMVQQRPATPTDPLAIARRAVDIAEDRQAHDILLLDVRGLCTYADAFVLLTAESKRQIEAIREEMAKGLRAVGRGLLHTEGDPEGGWVLMDFSDVIVHIFGPDERGFYKLENLWRQAVPLVRIQ
jgi:ribosome-associated protein